MTPLQRDSWLQTGQLPKAIGALMGMEENAMKEWRKRDSGELVCTNFSPHTNHNDWAMFCSWMHETEGGAYAVAFEEELRAAMHPYPDKIEKAPHLHIMNTPLFLRCRAALIVFKRIEVERKEKEEWETGRHVR